MFLFLGPLWKKRIDSTDKSESKRNEMEKKKKSGAEGEEIKRRKEVEERRRAKFCKIV